MSDEQPIFLDPHDDLNRVTERLAATTTQRVVMIVPQQTEMRSNVFWRLLYARAHGMGKEVTVISADRQMRSIAKVAGFRVADALDSSSPGKARPSRFARSPFESRQARQSRSQGSRASTGLTNNEARSRSVQSIGPGESERRSGEIRANRKSGTLRDRRGMLAGNRPSVPLETAQEPASQHTWSEAESSTSQAEEMLSGQGPEIDDDDRLYEYRIGASQAVPLQPQPQRKSSDEQDQDPYSPDYKFSKEIQNSWRSGLAPQSPPDEMGHQYDNEELSQAGQGYQDDEADSTYHEDRVSEFTVPPSAFDPASSVPGPGMYPEQGTTHQDPFAALEDRSSVSLPEQHAAARVEDIDEGIPDIAQKPDEIPNVHKIEDLGEDIGSVPTQKIPPEMYAGDPEEEQERRHFGSRPRGSRSGGLAYRPPIDFDDQDRLAPGGDRPAGQHIVPVQPVTPGPAPRPTRQSGGLTAARESRGALPPQQRTQRNGTPPAYPPIYQQPGQINRMGAPSGPVAGSTGVQPAQQSKAMAQPAHHGSRVAIIALLILVLLFLAGAGLFYFGTSATVTLTVPSQSISLSGIKLTASTNPQEKTQNSVASQVLSFTASQTGSGTATGTTPHGGAAASGIATFSNNGSKPVHLPTYTTISTTAGPGSVGISFLTTADAVIPAGYNGYPIQIQAKYAGPSGDVGAGKITVIPAESLKAIAAVNGVSVTSLNLSVNNSDAISGGAVTNAPAATQNDIDALKIKLHQQIQTEVKSWLHDQLHAQDQHGTPMPDVLGSAKPLSQEVLTQAPAVGHALSSRTITGTLSVQIKVLVVRTADLQAAAQQQLNAKAMKANPQYTVTTAKAPAQIEKVAPSSSKDGTLLTITLNAKAQTELYIETNKLSDYLAGKTIGQATSDISSGDAVPQGVQNVDIAVTPSFGLMPLRPEHIQIIVLPGLPAPTPNGTPNG